MAFPPKITLNGNGPGEVTDLRQMMTLTEADHLRGLVHQLTTENAHLKATVAARENENEELRADLIQQTGISHNLYVVVGTCLIAFNLILKLLRWIPKTDSARTICYASLKQITWWTVLPEVRESLHDPVLLADLERAKIPQITQEQLSEAIRESQNIQNSQNSQESEAPDA